MRFNGIKNFFSIEDRNSRKEQKDMLKRNMKIDEFRSEGLI